MKHKKNTLFCFSLFFLVGCGGVNLTDTKGNKYKFKNETVTCTEDSVGNIFCEGVAIKKDILGNRYLVDFPKEYCKYGFSGDLNKFSSFICSAGKKFGKW